MTPGSHEFKKHAEHLCPQRAGEPKALYLQRMARHFGIGAARMSTLYYDQRIDNARFTPEEVEIFSIYHPGINPDAKFQRAKEENAVKMADIEDLKKQLRVEIMNEITGKIVEALAS